MDNATYYAQLEQGARYLASLTANDDERREHLGWANRYRRLSSETAAPVQAPVFRVLAHSS